MYELKLADGRKVRWDGPSGPEAARRYVDAHREATVVAWRTWPRQGIFVGGGRIIG